MELSIISMHDNVIESICACMSTYSLNSGMESAIPYVEGAGYEIIGSSLLISLSCPLHNRACSLSTVRES